MAENYKKCWGCHTNFLILDDADAYQFKSSGIMRYGAASQECTAFFTKALFREQQWAGYPPMYKLIDTYGACHPPHLEIQKNLEIEPRLIRASQQSVIIHLIGLYLTFEQNMPFLKKCHKMKKILDSGIKLEELKLTPPLNFGPISILDVNQATNLQEYEKSAEQWALAVWQSWSAHHAMIAQICAQHLI